MTAFGAELLGWDDSALALVEEQRGWTEAVIEQLALTWIADQQRVGIPVRDQTGDELGLLRYRPAAGSGPKMLAGNGIPRDLFPPPELLTFGPLVFLVEGEPDAIRARALGLTATGVPGAQNWRAEWATRFTSRGATVIVLFDCDATGRENAERAAADLTAAGVEARIIDLDPARQDGYDLTDFTRPAVTADERVQARMLLEALAAAVEPYRLPDHRLLIPYHELRTRHEAEDTTDWVWAQLVAPGYLTRIDGRPKIAGKSTLLFALCAAIRNGQKFLGQETRPATVAYCSEQRWQTLHQKLILPYGAPPYMHLYHDEPLNLAELIPRLIEETEQLGVEVVIIDTVSKWLRLSQGGRFDPDIMAANMGLLEQLSQRCAVVVADYTRKGDSPRGEGTLGATEQTGRADILIELKRPDSEQPNVRRLEITGRSDAPEEIDYTINAEHVLELCDLDEIQLAGEAQAILELLRDIERNGDPAPSGNTIAKRLGKRKETILDQLEQLRDQERVYRLGSGRGQIWALNRTSREPMGTDGNRSGTEAEPDDGDEFVGLF